MLGYGGNPIPTVDDIAEAVLRLVKGIADTLGHTERPATTLSPTTELAYQEAERIRKAVPNEQP